MFRNFSQGFEKNVHPGIFGFFHPCWEGISHSSALMSYTKPKYIQKSITIIPGSLEDFAPGDSLKGEGLPLPAPVPLFVHSVDFCGFRVGDGGGYDRDSIQPILYIFRVSV